MKTIKQIYLEIKVILNNFFINIFINLASKISLPHLKPMGLGIITKQYTQKEKYNVHVALWPFI